ncbi:hypothetical protein [Hydrogenophaga sp. NFH-34]|uniref:hypothetical protein n=1 Tax=Hydrogenophaga sp. NFH-34 TaxID=2744446 RepID=UPI001F2FB1CA|nr:hypothetical protein [Hydrogenophaga sp. NFH-34]
MQATTHRLQIDSQPLDDAIVKVEPSQMEAFHKHLAALNKKAAKFGLEPIKILGTTSVRYRLKSEAVDEDGEKVRYFLVPARDGDQDRIARLVILNHIHIQYPIIKLGNWQVVGKLEALDGGNMSFCATGNPEDAQALRDRVEHDIHCDHCRKQRRRLESYVLREHESGAYMQVGKGCLKDFTGIDPAAALFLARMSTLASFSDGDLESFGSSGRGNAVDTNLFLAIVSFLTANYGFVSSVKSRDTGAQPTWSWASSLIDGVEREDYEFRRRYKEQFENHYARAQAIRAWVEAKPVQSDFDHNLKLLVQGGYLKLDSKHLAVAAAAVPQFNRTEAVKAEPSPPSVHVGTPGQKMTATVKIERVIRIETYYGPSDLVLMRDDVGNVLLWKTSACPAAIREDGVGRSLQATFKVKGHDVFKGTAQTTVTHFKVLKQAADEARADTAKVCT